MMIGGREVFKQMLERIEWRKRNVHESLKEVKGRKRKVGKCRNGERKRKKEERIVGYRM